MTNNMATLMIVKLLAIEENALALRNALATGSMLKGHYPRPADTIDAKKLVTLFDTIDEIVQSALELLVGEE